MWIKRKPTPLTITFPRLDKVDMELAMPQGVLVLNRFWQAVHICSVRRAFSLLYMGHAQVVEGNGPNGHGVAPAR